MRLQPLAALFDIALLLAGCSSSPPAEAMIHGQPLSHWLDDLKTAPDAKARKHAARVLGNVGPVDPAIVPALAAALKDKAADVRQEAITALEKIGPAAQEALPALEAAQRDPDARVRAKAVEAVTRLKTAR